MSFQEGRSPRQAFETAKSNLIKDFRNLHPNQSVEFKMLWASDVEFFVERISKYLEEDPDKYLSLIAQQINKIPEAIDRLEDIYSSMALHLDVLKHAYDELYYRESMQ